MNKLPLDSCVVSQYHLWLGCLAESCCSSAGASSSQGPLPQGPLKAKVVAADSIRSADSLKEVVVYKIRAADARGEWTVSRRYSNFELLHRQLRDVRHTRHSIAHRMLIVCLLHVHGMSHLLMPMTSP